MLSTDLNLWGHMCAFAAKNQDNARLREFVRKIAARLLEASEQAEGMENTPVCLSETSGHTVIDLSDDTIIPFPKAKLRVVSNSDEGGAA
ncbi:MAG: hypothetical protein ABJQ71_15250 [Roseibium sp.]